MDFWRGIGFNATDDLGLYPKGSCNGDDGIRMGRIHVDFHSVAHVEDSVHFAPRCLRLLLDQFEQWRDGKEVVLDDFSFSGKVQHFGLRTSRAMHHTADVRTELLEDFRDDGCIGARG